MHLYKVLAFDIKKEQHDQDRCIGEYHEQDTSSKNKDSKKDQYHYQADQ